MRVVLLDLLMLLKIKMKNRLTSRGKEKKECQRLRRVIQI